MMKTGSKIKHKNLPKIQEAISIGILLIICFSCKDKNNEPKCPPFDQELISPYDDPICHPSGQIIGYNHIPLKEIIYDYGFECPLQAEYLFDLNEAGFYIMDSNGQNQRRILPYNLTTPSWSPDGKWIVFSTGDIYKMPFDGNCFDTASIIQLTTSGHNFFPKWSPDGNYIAYDNTICGSASTPIPPNSCGILKMDSDGNNKLFIIQARRFPFWGKSADTIYYGLRYFDPVTQKENIIFDTALNGFSVYGPPSFNPQKTKIFFLVNYAYVSSPIKLASIDPSGANFHIVSNDAIQKFSFLPDGRIVYILYPISRIDDETGTFWIMDQDGTNKHQLTYNNFNISYK